MLERHRERARAAGTLTAFHDVTDLAPPFGAATRGRLSAMPVESGSERNGAMLPLHAHVRVGNRLGHMRQPLI